jgi:hypothetical protein
MCSEVKRICGIANQAQRATKAQDVAMSQFPKHNRLLKLPRPGRTNRRKHGVNPHDSGRFPQIFLKNTIDKNPSLE